MFTVRKNLPRFHPTGSSYFALLGVLSTPTFSLRNAVGVFSFDLALRYWLIILKLVRMLLVSSFLGCGEFFPQISICIISFYLKIVSSGFFHTIRVIE